MATAVMAAPEAIFIPATANDMRLIAPQLTFHDLRAELFGLSSWNNSLLLREAGASMEQAGSRMDNIVKMTVLLTDREHYPVMRRTEFEYYRRHAPRLVEDPPASTVMIVELGKPDYLVELDVVGVVARD